MENPQVTMGFSTKSWSFMAWMIWGTPMTWETIGNLHVKLAEHVPPMTDRHEVFQASADLHEVGTWSEAPPKT